MLQLALELQLTLMSLLLRFPLQILSLSAGASAALGGMPQTHSWARGTQSHCSFLTPGLPHCLFPAVKCLAKLLTVLLPEHPVCLFVCLARRPAETLN